MRVEAVQWICRTVLVGPLLRMWGRPRVIGAEHLPRRGPVVIAANHLAAVDSLYLALAARRPVHFLAKSEYFDGHGIAGRIARWFMAATGQIPVDRRGGDAAGRAMQAAVGIIDRGGAWGIHPEGTRSSDGRMYRGRTGVIRVAMATGAPVIPVAIVGTQSAPESRRCRRRVTITVLEPFDLGPFADDAPGVRAATDALMAVIAAASGQEMVEDYARRWHGDDETAA